MLNPSQIVGLPGKIQLLIVEDDYTQALSLHKKLESLGYTILDMANTGTAAIEKAAELRPNLVLMDIQLHGEMDGVQAAEQIWSQLHIPIIYLTGQADQHTVERATLTAPFGYLLKPVRTQELYVAIQTALSRYNREHSFALEHARQLGIQLAEVQRLNQLKENFLAMTSHELRTPLSNIKLAIRLLETVLERQDLSILQEEETAQSLDRYLSILHDQCDQELNLVNDLLDIRSLDADAFPLDFISIQLQNWLPHVVEAFQERTHAQQQSLQVTIFPNLPAIASDMSALTRIVSELVNNACKYTPQGGQISVTAQPLPVSQSSNADNAEAADLEWIQLQVSNSGVNIPVEEQSHIFEPFYRVPQSDRWKYSGTGLGLALVKKLVEHLRGRINVTSEAGWVTFTLLLPINGRDLPDTISTVYPTA